MKLLLHKLGDCVDEEEDCEDEIVTWMVCDWMLKTRPAEGNPTSATMGGAMLLLQTLLLVLTNNNKQLLLLH